MFQSNGHVRGEYKCLEKMVLNPLHKSSWCGDFVEKHSFHGVSGDLPKTMGKLSLSTKFTHLEIR